MIRVVTIVVACVLSGCAGPPRAPAVVLADPDASAGHLARAMDALPADPDRSALVAGVVTGAGFLTEARLIAFDRLERDDPAALRAALERDLPDLDDYRALEALCPRIAAAGWTELTGALGASLARPVAGVPDAERPEYAALTAWFGEAGVVPALAETVAKDGGVRRARQRTLVWGLVYRLGGAAELARVVQAEPPPDDALRIDLHAAWRAWGVVPDNRETILWLRSLRRPERAEFRAALAAAIERLPAARRADLEPRDLATLVTAARVAPEVFEQSDAELDRWILRARGSDPVFVHRQSVDPGDDRPREAFDDWRHRLTWGDRAALVLALRARDSADLRAALFALATEDRLDADTELGGIVQFDADGRGDVVAFRPFRKEHDRKYIAPPGLFETAYTGGFHFHLHAQDLWNRRYAGPGWGDLGYAERTRANCLVFTTIDADTLAMDFYRHGRVRIDLGLIRRDPSAS